jgi:hypothetical protein
VAGVSDTTTVALAAVIVSGMGVLASLGFNFWNASSERKQRLKERSEDSREWYSRALFEKRIDAVQDAYVWIMRLNRYANVFLSDQSDENREKLRTTCLDAREWYDGKALFLYDDLPMASEMVGLINTAAAVGHPALKGSEFFVQVNAASREVRSRLDSLMSKAQAGIPL